MRRFILGRLRLYTALTAAILVILLGLAGTTSAVHAQSPSSRYAVEHVIFGGTQLELLTTGLWAPYVHDDRDSFLLMSGNNEGDINCEMLNAWAKMVRERHPNAPIHAATSGIRNVLNGVACLDTTLFSGIALVYEPNQLNAPEFTWDRAETELLLGYASSVARAHGLEAWTKISGRAAEGRDQFGKWDYGVIGTLLDGQIVQTQGSCRDVDGDGDFVHGEREFGAALRSVLDMYAGAAATAALHIRITTSSEDTNVNTVTAAQALQCAETAWAQPVVNRVTLRTAVGDLESLNRATTFYQLREVLIRGAPSVFAQATDARSAPPAATQLPTREEQQPTRPAGMPAYGEIHGEVPQAGLGLLVWGGGPVDVLVNSADATSCTTESVWLIEDGAFVGYLANAPAAVNTAFFMRFSGGDLPPPPVIVRCRTWE